MTAVASLVLTAVAFWIARHPPAALDAYGTPGWIAWIAIVVGGWTFGLFVLLVKTTLTAIDRSLVPDLAMTPVAVEQVRRTRGSSMASCGTPATWPRARSCAPGSATR